MQIKFLEYQCLKRDNTQASLSDCTSACLHWSLW
jgi:hypothetical protein